MIEQNFWTTFFGTLSALLATIFGGLIVQFFIRRSEEKKIIELLGNDCRLNWRNIEWCKITPTTNEPERETYIYKEIKLTLKGVPEYKFSISTLKLFETEGTNIAKYLNRKQSTMFWELFNLLFDLENTRQILEKTEQNDVNYHSYQKMFVIFAEKSMDLYIKLVNDLETKALIRFLI